MNIIAYIYEADYHCVACAQARFGVEPGRGWVREDAVDREGNSVHPVFSIDEWCEAGEAGVQTLVCGTCDGEIEVCDHGTGRMAERLADVPYGMSLGALRRTYG